MVTQALVVSVVTKRFSDYTLTSATTAVTALAFAAMSQISSMAALYAVCTPLVVANTIYQQVNTRQVSHASPAGVKGFMMATDMVRALHALPALMAQHRCSSRLPTVIMRARLPHCALA